MHALDKATGQLVAVKQILEDETMMNRETQILKLVGSHPNLISCKQHFYTIRPAMLAFEMPPPSTCSTSANTR